MNKNPNDAGWLASNPVSTLRTQDDVLTFVRIRHQLAELTGDVDVENVIQAFETRELVDRLTLLFNREGAYPAGAEAAGDLLDNGAISVCYDDIGGMPARIFEEIWKSLVTFAAEASYAASSVRIRALKTASALAEKYGWPDDSLAHARFGRAWATVADLTDGTDVSDDSIAILQKLPDGVRSAALQAQSSARSDARA